MILYLGAKIGFHEIINSWLDLQTDYLGLLLTKASIVVRLGENYWANNPSQPDWDLKHHQDEDERSFPVVVFDMFWLDREATDKDDKEDDVEQGEHMISCSEATGRNES